MPFVSKAQRAWMYANKPEMAKEWESKTTKQLPERLGKTRAQKATNKLSRGMAGKKR